MMERRQFNCVASRARGASSPFSAVPVAEILCWPDEDQQRLRLELERLFRDAFVRMPENEIQNWVGDFFTQLVWGLQRYALLLANESDQLIATTLFDYGQLESAGRTLQGVYIIDRAVASGYQDSGLGRSMAAEILRQFQPDILMTTCTQSASLHSWISAVQQGFAGEWEVFPRWEHQTSRPFPVENHDFAVKVFRQLYGGIAKGDQASVDRAVANLSLLLVRKAVYGERYDTRPWEKAGRKDLLAEALGAGLGDGILLVIVRKGLRAR